MRALWAERFTVWAFLLGVLLVAGDGAAQVAWSTYLGGSDHDWGYGIAVDASGNAYATGYTYSSGWVSGGWDTSRENTDVYVVKLDTAGAHLWSTYLGGTGIDYGYGIAVDASGNAYATGNTYSPGWVSGGWDTSFGGGNDGYVVKLNTAGAHLWSTYLGGTIYDEGYGIAVDSDGNVYATGYTNSSDWVSGGWNTTHNGAYDYDGYVVKLDTTGAHLWSTYLGEMGADEGYGIAVDSNGNVYATGYTDSSGWVSGGWDLTRNGDDYSSDGYVVKLSTTGAHLWSTYLGATYEPDESCGIAVDASGNIYVTGNTNFSGWVSGGWNTSYNGGYCDGYVVKLDTAGAHLWSTYLGGTDEDYGYGIAVDSSGNVYATGATWSDGWVNGGWNTSYNSGDSDGYVIKLNTAGAHLWSTYLGGTYGDRGYGIAVDLSGNAYATGWTQSSGWVSGGWNTSDNGGYCDGYVVKIAQSGGGEDNIPGCIGGTLSSPRSGLGMPAGDFALMASAAAIVLWLGRRRRTAHA